VTVEIFGALLPFDFFGTRYFYRPPSILITIYAKRTYMQLRKAALLAFASTLFISGCELTDEEKERVEKAEDNLEKVALAPQITQPSADESISGTVEVYVDVDTSVMETYESVTLFIEGRPELVDTEFPYEFSFNSYYWSDNEKISLLAKVETLGGNQLRSDVISVPVAATANTALAISYPQNNSVFRSINEVSLNWNALEGADSYEYQINDGGSVFTDATSAQVSLPELGNYQVKVRATNAEDHTGAWSTAVNFSLLQPEITQITAPSNGQTFQNVNQINLQWVVIESAAYYESQLNSDEIIRIDENQMALANIALGNHQVKVRSVDTLGFTSDWTETITFTLAAPNSPSISNTEVSDTDEAFELAVAITNGMATNEVQIATDDLFTENSIVATESGVSEQLDSVLAAGIYYVRARTSNEFGHVSGWSNGQEVTVGLFAHAINMATGVSDYDQPVALVFDEGSFVVATSQGPLIVGTSDSFYVTKIAKDGAKEWGTSLQYQAGSPKTMRKTESGYLLTATGIEWFDAVVLELDNNGEFIWKETFSAETGILDGIEFYTREYLYDAVELATNEYALLGKFEKRNRSGDWSSSLLEAKNKITFLDRSSDTSVRTEYEFTQPATGGYNNINDLLLTDENLYAVGAYKTSSSPGDSTADDYVPIQGASGAVLFEVDKIDGSIVEEGTRTAGGLGDRYSGDAVQASEGDIYVSYSTYNSAAASIFHSTGQSTDFLSTYGMTGEKLAVDNDNNVYMAGSATESNLPRLLVRFNNAVEQQRLSLSKYGKNLYIKSITYDRKYGVIVLATNKGGLIGADSSDRYTVIFNVSDSMQYLAPVSVVTDYGQ